MHSLDEIQTRLEKIQKKIVALEGNNRIYHQSRLLLGKQSRFEHQRKNAEIEKNQAFHQALKLVKNKNKQSLEEINQHAKKLREELFNLQYWAEAIAVENNTNAEECINRIYAAQIKLTENWPLNSSQKRDYICPITEKVLDRRSVLLSNGCQYSKEGLRRLIEGAEFFPRQLPGSHFSLSENDIKSVTARLSVAEKISSGAFRTGYITGAVPGLALIGLSVITLLTSFFFPPAAVLVLPFFFAGVGTTLGLSLIVGAAFAAVGWIGGMIKDAAILPSRFEPAVSALSTPAKLNVAMGIKSGQEANRPEQDNRSESAPLIENSFLNDGNDLRPVYVPSTSNRL